MGRRLIAGVLLLATVCLAIGCHVPGRKPEKFRNPLEQMLLSQAIERSAESAILGLPEGTRVVLDSTGLSNDHGLVVDVVEGWLGMIVQAVGNDQDIKFFGIVASRLLSVPPSSTTIHPQNVGELFRNEI